MKKAIGIIVIIILCFGILFAIKVNYNPTSMLVEKADKLYGDEYCSLDLTKLEESYYKMSPLQRFVDRGDNDHPSIAGMAETEWRCKLCGYKGIARTTATPELCSTCAALTNRCAECGKRHVPKEEIEAAREKYSVPENKIDNE